MTGIEDIAVSWLADPAWQKVFKHTVDIFQDYVSYVLVRFNILYCVDRLTFQMYQSSIFRLLLEPFVCL